MLKRDEKDKWCVCVPHSGVFVVRKESGASCEDGWSVLNTLTGKIFSICINQKYLHIIYIRGSVNVNTTVTIRLTLISYVVTYDYQLDVWNIVSLFTMIITHGIMKYVVLQREIKACRCLQDVPPRKCFKYEWNQSLNLWQNHLHFKWAERSSETHFSYSFYCHSLFVKQTLKL